MKIQSVWQWVLGLGLVVGAGQIPLGCDSGTGDTSELDNYFANHPYVADPRAGGSVVVMTPSSAEVDTVGARAVFSINGGTAPYTWDVADSSKGTISGSGGQGIYTATAVGNNEVIAYDQNGNAAIANITASSSLTINANPITLATNGSMAVITASGGVPPYAWSFADPLKGSLAPLAGASVVYTRGAVAGDNAVTVADSSGLRASVVLKQQ